MKSNLAILSSDTKSINFIKDLNLDKFCNLYANCSRNVEVAEKFSKEHNFLKYYGSYEELLDDNNIDFVINFLPSGIKFEYNYLILKRNIKVITDYPFISNNSDLNFYYEIIKNNSISNIFLIDNLDIRNLYKKATDHKYITYYKDLNLSETIDNNLSNSDILFELCPDLFFFINKHKDKNIDIKIFDRVKDKITNKIKYLNCTISFNSSLIIQVILDNGHTDNKHLGYKIDNSNEINGFIFNKEDLINFINLKKPFDNLSEFQYYPFKLFQEVLNE